MYNAYLKIVPIAECTLHINASDRTVNNNSYENELCIPLSIDFDASCAREDHGMTCNEAIFPSSYIVPTIPN